MPKSGPHKPRTRPVPPAWRATFIKQWRIYRGMTVEQLSEASGMSTGNISAIENRRQGYSEEGLDKLSSALKTTPGALLTVDPLSEGAGDFWALWERASPKDRETLTIMAARLVGPEKPRK